MNDFKETFKKATAADIERLNKDVDIPQPIFLLAIVAAALEDTSAAEFASVTGVNVNAAEWMLGKLREKWPALWIDAARGWKSDNG